MGANQGPLLAEERTGLRHAGAVSGLFTDEPDDCSVPRLPEWWPTVRVHLRVMP